MTKLLTKQSAKLDKSQTDDILNYIMYLDPTYNRSICPSASAGCKKSCLIHSGRMRMSNAQQARYNRTHLYFTNKQSFNSQLIRELTAASKLATRQNKKLAVRLNGTSDIDWSNVYKMFPSITFYEYTKRLDLVDSLKSIPNVHLTFSKNETHTESDVQSVALKGINVAVVFKNDIPSTYANLPVIDGDKHDRRFEDTPNAIVGLKLKGTIKAKKHAIKTKFAV